MTRAEQTVAATTLAALALIGFVGVAIADVGPSVAAALEATRTALAARALADEVSILAAGGALVGLGTGTVVASGVTYWYQNRQIGGRLE